MGHYVGDHRVYSRLTPTREARPETRDVRSGRYGTKRIQFFLC